MKSFELSISPDNVPHWGVWEGCREFIQNALDQDGFEYKIDNGKLTLGNNGTLTKSYFITGESGKRDDNTSRGNYGEGAKAALSCLLRNNKHITILSNTTQYIPKIKYSENFDSDVIEISQQTLSFGMGNAVFVAIEDLSESEVNIISNNVLQFKGEYLKASAKRGDLLLDPSEAGRIYVGGLFVLKESNMEYGYDFKPEYFKLDRDRNLARTYDIHKMCAHILHECQANDDIPTEKVVDNLVNKKADTDYSDCGVEVSDAVKDGCFESLSEGKPDVIITGSQEESRKLKASGYQNVVYTSNTVLAQIAKSSPKYKTIERTVEIKSPITILEEFRDSHLVDQSIAVIAAFNAIIKLVKNLL